MKRLSVVVILALLASILFSSSAVAVSPLAKRANVCDDLMSKIITLQPGSAKFESSLEKAAKFNCGIAMDRGALLALYYSAGGDTWYDNTNWFTNPDHCTWYGISCSERRVDRVSLSGIVGSIPPEIGYLSRLTYLDLEYGGLSGSIPPEIGNLTNLTHLFLNNNTLSGPIPPELGNLHNLQILMLKVNQLSGPIPPELGNLTSLRGLDLRWNVLNGSIPPELGNLSNLTLLELASNHLTGFIPPELGNLSNLVKLHLAANQLSGPIPPELGNFHNLIQLLLMQNQLSGQVPKTFSNYSRDAIGHEMDIVLFSGGNSGLCVPIDVYNLIISQYTDFSEQNICVQ